ncbi:MAG: hypothetical protein KJ709_01565 [Nanoarchaeota archaeon]|nr:hypothetical protein [Nanoarchaeota archaeon]
MIKEIPKILLKSKYRKEMWNKAQKILKTLEKTLPISSAYLLGSFTTKKKRPADVDFILLLQMRDNNQDSKWSVDLVLAPENKYGNFVLDDAKKWMKQKYGTNKSAVIKLK